MVSPSGACSSLPSLSVGLVPAGVAGCRVGRLLPWGQDGHLHTTCPSGGHGPSFFRVASLLPAPPSPCSLTPPQQLWLCLVAPGWGAVLGKADRPGQSWSLGPGPVGFGGPFVVLPACVVLRLASWLSFLEMGPTVRTFFKELCCNYTADGWFWSLWLSQLALTPVVRHLETPPRFPAASLSHRRHTRLCFLLSCTCRTQLTLGDLSRA